MPTYMLRTTLDRLNKRLEEIQREKYVVARELQEAASQGDLSENAEYDIAKEKKEMLALEERRIKEYLGDAQLIEEISSPSDVVSVGKRVKIQDAASGKEQVFAIIGELDKMEGVDSLSVGAPLARGLLGKKLGRSVEVQLPRETRRYKILEISNLF